MSTDRVTSDLFVGREEELEEFRQFLEEESSAHLLNLHSNGHRGVGKTQLLIRMQAICAARSETVIFTKTLLDFYHIETHSKIGLMRELARRLDASLPIFNELVKRYQGTIDFSERDVLFPQIETAFAKEYAAFANAQTQCRKILVLFFDTYEVLQTPLASTGAEHIKASNFLTWIETAFFATLLQPSNVRIVVSGRYPLQEIDRSQHRVHEIVLRQFSYKEALDFWQQCFRVAIPEHLIAKMQIASETQLHILYDLANGHPILLALIADWVQYLHIREPFSIKTLLEKIARQTDKNFTSTLEQQEEFERELIGRVALMADPESRAITLMAIAYHRMTPDLFHHLTGMPLEACEKTLWQTLRPLSFIKYKEDGNIVLLHDEMRRLVLQHFWENQDPVRTMRKAIAGDLLNYYDNLLANETLTGQERETYWLERISYAFLAKGVEEFCDEFDMALGKRKFDYADLLLHEAEKYIEENPGDIPLLDVLLIRVRRISYEARVSRNREDVLQKINAFLTEYHAKEYILLRERLIELKQILEHQLEPSNVSFQRITESAHKETLTTEPIRLLHLSDLHFSRQDDIIARLHPLANDLNDNLNITQIDYLVITGDLTNHGTPEEFEKAKEFINKVLVEFHLNIKHCIVVPGNHDVFMGDEVYTWKSCGNIDISNLDEYLYYKVCEKESLKGYLIQDEMHYPKRFENFSKCFYMRLFGKEYPVKPDDQCLTHCFEDGIQFVAINSCWQIDQVFPDRSGVNKTALLRGLHELKGAVHNRQVCEPRLRIAVLHHHIYGKDRIQHIGFIKHLQNTGVGLVILHGHIYENNPGLFHYPHPDFPEAHFIGAGTFRLSETSIPQFYNVLEIQRDFSKAVIHTRFASPENEYWTEQKIWPQQSSCSHESFYSIVFQEDNMRYILHLSDIHIGTKDEAQKYRMQLETDLKQRLRLSRLDYLIVSGDIANTSQPEEYAAAVDLIDGIMNRFSIQPERVILTPGNHDLNWGLAEQAYEFVPKSKLPDPLSEEYIPAGDKGALKRNENLYPHRFDYFNEHFYKKICGGKEYPLSPEKQGILYEYPEDRMLFLSLNSSWNIDPHHEQRASINMNALTRALDRLQDDQYNEWLKIAVWHHPVTGREMMKNEFLQLLSEHHFQICMHGHIHETIEEFYKRDLRHGIHIIGSGTFGAPLRKQEGIPLQYNLFKLDPEQAILTVETRKKEKSDGAWAPDARWFDGENPDPVPRYTIQLKQWNSPFTGTQNKPSVKSSRISSQLRQKIVDFLVSLPNIQDNNARNAFIESVGFDSQLHAQIDFSGAAATFFHRLLANLRGYGSLNDGRNAIEALLKTAKNYIGPDRQADCESLIDEFRRDSST